MTNSQMKPGRYLRWHNARKRIAWIQAKLTEGMTVQLTTYTKATRYTAKHRDMFRAARDGAYVQRGKHWDCIDGCHLTAYRR